ncbi:MAG: hypothetical protein HKN94_09570 [Acidimicrobiales bacterium]|nr:hypothetical protein [Acidimicrobiales bacterium]
MDFDDRLKQHIHRQSDDLVITPEGTGAVEKRSRRRRQRRSAAVVVAAVLAIAGIGSIVSNQNNGTEVRLAAPDTEEAQEDESTGSEEGPAAGTSGDIQRGSSLVLTDTANAQSPGGFNVWNNTFDNGIYYVLSTAPGKTFEDYEREGNYEGRPDTLYSWDGNGWSVSTFGERYVNELLSDNGVLYTISTGSPAGPDLAVGSSNDRGESWTWTSLDPTGSTPSDAHYHTVSDADDGKVLVAISRPEQPDWDEAIELANGAGLDISYETSDILNIDFDGVEWFEGGYEPFPVGPCTAASNDFYQGYEESFIEPPFYAEEFGELSDEEQSEFDAWAAAEEERYQQLEQERLEILRGIGGCEEYVQCTVQANDIGKSIDEQISAIFDGIKDPTAEQHEAADKLWAKMEEFYATSGCDDVFSEGFIYEEGEVREPEYVSWEELGVSVPESWRGSTMVFLLEDGVASELPKVESPDGFLNRAEVLADSFQLTFDTTEYAGEGPVEPSTNVLTSNGVDGWVASASTVPFRSLEAPPRVGEFTFDVVWGGSASGGGALLRTDGNGDTVKLNMADLGGDIDTEGYDMYAAAGGDYGVVAWATKFKDVDDGISGYFVDSMLFHSPDGITWGATPVHGLSINDVLVGASEALVFTSDPALANSGEAQPVLRASLG